MNRIQYFVPRSAYSTRRLLIVRKYVDWSRSRGGDRCGVGSTLEESRGKELEGEEERRIAPEEAVSRQEEPAESEHAGGGDPEDQKKRGEGVNQLALKKPSGTVGISLYKIVFYCKDFVHESMMFCPRSTPLPSFIAHTIAQYIVPPRHLFIAIRTIQYQLWQYHVKAKVGPL